MKATSSKRPLITVSKRSTKDQTRGADPQLGVLFEREEDRPQKVPVSESLLPHVPEHAVIKPQLAKQSFPRHCLNGERKLGSTGQDRHPPLSKRAEQGRPACIKEITDGVENLRN